MVEASKSLAAEHPLIFALEDLHSSANANERAVHL
jgi:hypothetical protein